MKSFLWIKYALWAVLISVFVVAANAYLDEPVMLRYGPWQAAPSGAVAAGTAVILAVALVIVLKILGWIFSLPQRLSAWRRGRAISARDATLLAGSRASALGQHKQVLKHFGKLAGSNESAAFAWLAAEAAHKAGDEKNRVSYLNRAAAGEGEIAAAAKAQLAIDGGRFHDALSVLKSAGAPAAGAPLLAGLYLHAAKSSGKWDAALAAAYRLRENSPSAKSGRRLREVTLSALANTGDAGELKSMWKNSIRSEEQKHPQIAAEYAYALRRVGDAPAAIEILERALKSSPGTPELLSAVAALGGRKLCESAYAGAQKSENKDDSQLLAAMGELAERLELWGKARRYYQMADSLHSDPRFARALARLEEQMKSADESGSESAENFPRP